MQVKVENKSNVERKIIITISAQESAQAYQQALRNVTKNARIDGFRKGHVPANILKSQFAFEISSQTVNKLVKDTLYKALEDEKIPFMGTPTVDFPEIYEENKDFTYEAIVDVEIDLELKPYSELDVQRVKAEVTEADLDKMIQSLRKQQIKWQVKDDFAIAEGTLAKIDFTGRVDGIEFEGGKAQDFSLQVGKTHMIPGFTEQLIGHKAGESFTIKVKFPADYHVETLKDKDAEFDIVINTVSEGILPEINEDFAKIYGVKDGNLDSFKQELRKNMERELSNSVINTNSNNVFEALLKQYGEFDVPQSIVNLQIESLYENRIHQMQRYGVDLRRNKDFDPQKVFAKEGKSNARLSQIIRCVAKQAEIKDVSQEYIDKHLNTIAMAYEKPDEVIKSLKNNKKQYAEIVERAFQNQVVDYVLDQANKGEKTMSFDELIGFSDN